jgi:hypothetical protein
MSQSKALLQASISLIDRLIREKQVEVEQAKIARDFEKPPNLRQRSCRPQHDRPAHGARWGNEPKDA